MVTTITTRQESFHGRIMTVFYRSLSENEAPLAKGIIVYHGLNATEHACLLAAQEAQLGMPLGSDSVDIYVNGKRCYALHV